MPGIFIEINNSLTKQDMLKDSAFDYHYHKDISFVCVQTAVKKFQGDKVFFNSEQYFLVLDGAVLNKYKLLENSLLDWSSFLIEKYKQYGELFFTELRGSFCGALFDKFEKKWIVFSDHIGTKRLYFSQIDSVVLISSEIKWITDYYKTINREISICEEGIIAFLKYGYYFEDLTIVNQIKKIEPGYFITISDKKIKKLQFYLLDNEPNYNINESKLIDQIDDLFLAAVDEGLKKNKEYGYPNYLTLSGGLDSRMVLFAANKLCGENIITFTFAQSNSLDEIIAKEIADDLGYEWLFKSLDNGLFLFNIDEITRLTGGIALNFGHAHGWSTYRLLDKSKIGLIHTGQLGDVVVGTCNSGMIQSDKYKVGEGAYSQRNINQIKEIKLKHNYKNREMYFFNVRYFSGTNTGLVVTQSFTEAYSPFMDIELLNKALSVPVKLRYNHHFYKKWILSKYPKAANYIWETTRNKINSPYLPILGREIYLDQIIPRFVQILYKSFGIKKSTVSKYKSMNPLNYYYNNNVNLQVLWDQYFKDNLTVIPEKYIEYVRLMYFEGNAIDKNIVLSLLSSIKYYFYA